MQNIAFNISDHLSKIIRSSFEDSEIARNYTSNRTKATAIINNVTGSVGFERTLHLIKNYKITLIVDESIDTGSIKKVWH